MHLGSKFGDPSLNRWWVMAQTSSGLTYTLNGQTQATTIPKRQNWPRVKTYWEQTAFPLTGLKWCCVYVASTDPGPLWRPHPCCGQGRHHRSRSHHMETIVLIIHSIFLSWLYVVYHGWSLISHLHLWLLCSIMNGSYLGHLYLTQLQCVTLNQAMNFYSVIMGLIL